MGDKRKVFRLPLDSDGQQAMLELKSTLQVSVVRETTVQVSRGPRNVARELDNFMRSGRAKP